MFLSIKSFKSLFIFSSCFIFFFDFVYMSFMVSNQFLQAPPIVYECRWTSTATRVLYAPRPTSDGVTSRERRSIEGTTILATGRDEGDLNWWALSMEPILYITVILGYSLHVCGLSPKFVMTLYLLFLSLSLFDLCLLI